jgi:Flp pilus assembly protein TadD
MIPTSRRLEYALGYVSLGLIAEAEAELAAVCPDDREAPEVAALRLELHMAAKRWDLVAEQARALLLQDQDNVGAWVALGCAVRRVENVAAARDLLLRAEPLHGAKHAVIHYNLACYFCLLGEHEAAKARLAIACRMDPSFKHTALEDPDLEAIGDAVRALAGK